MAGRRQFFRFAPAIGAYQRVLLEAVSAGLVADSEKRLREEVGRVLSDVDEGREVSEERLAFAFAAALLADVLAAGGECVVKNSRNMFVRWPDWSAEDGRKIAKRALQSSTKRHQETRQSGVKKLECLAGHMFAPEMTAAKAAQFLHDAELQLRPCQPPYGSVAPEENGECSPSPYAAAFKLGVRVWNMPYRGREGRAKQFVVTGKAHGWAGAPEWVVGLIEVGDDAPYSTARDEALFLTTEKASQWLLRRGESDAGVFSHIADRLKRLRAALKPIPGIPSEHLRGDAHALVRQAEQLERQASGRSRSDERLWAKKGIAYALRLAQGEEALRSLSERGRADDPAVKLGLRAAVRVLHNLSLPSIHMDVTVCGAVPPFTAARAGKLVVAFLAEPRIIDCPLGAKRSILGRLFEVEALKELLPDHGLLMVTTKGLYPRHSALYNRASVPGKGSSECESKEIPECKLKKIGETAGATTSLLGDETARLARLLQEKFPVSGGTESRVSMAYGSGGAKRQRTIERAVVSLGLPADLASAGITRPVYGLHYVKNVAEVVWLGEAPEWSVERSLSPREYGARAKRIWQRRWAAKGQSESQAMTPGVIECLHLGPQQPPLFS